MDSVISRYHDNYGLGSVMNDSQVVDRDVFVFAPPQTGTP